MLGNLVIPAPVQVGLAFLKKTWPLFLGAALCIALVISQLQLKTANVKLKGEAEFREVLKDTLDAPNATAPTLIITARARVSESQDRKATLVRISTETVAAKKRAEVADGQLKKAQAENAKNFAEARAQIAALRNRKPSGNAAQDAAALDEDSKSAWKGWK